MKVFRNTGVLTLTNILGMSVAFAAITLAVVTLQSWRAANANPVDSLKIE